MKNYKILALLVIENIAIIILIGWLCYLFHSGWWTLLLLITNSWSKDTIKDLINKSEKDENSEKGLDDN